MLSQSPYFRRTEGYGRKEPTVGIAHGREDRGRRGPSALKYDGVLSVATYGDD